MVSPIYAPISDIPLTISNKCRPPKVHTPSSGAISTIDVDVLFKYPFEIEKTVLEATTAYKDELKKQEQLSDERTKRISEKRANRDKEKREQEEAEKQRIMEENLKAEEARKKLEQEKAEKERKRLEAESLKSQNLGNLQQNGNTQQNSAQLGNLAQTSAAGLMFLRDKLTQGTTAVENYVKTSNIMQKVGHPGKSGTAATDTNSSSNQTPVTDSQSQAQAKESPKLNYLEFEHGLPPPNPWDTPATVNDDIQQLQDAMSSNSSFNDFNQYSSSPSYSGPAPNPYGRPNVYPPPQNSTYSKSQQPPAPIENVTSGMGTVNISNPQPWSYLSPRPLPPNSGAPSSQSSPPTYNAQPSNKQPPPLPPPRKQNMPPPFLTPKPTGMQSPANSNGTGLNGSYIPMGSVVMPMPMPIPTSASNTKNSSNSPSPSSNNKRFSNVTSKPIPPVPARCQSDPRLLNIFVDTHAMGFSYEGIDTGIKLFKYDRRRILDFCIIHDESLSHGCTSQDIEASYALFDTESNFEKFAKYMKAFSTLREMGFELNQIRESLILSGYDQEKALEILAKD